MKSLLAIIALAFSLNSVAAETKEPVKKATVSKTTTEKKPPSANKPKVKKKAEKEATK
jgi:hypothetical protein